MVMVGIDIGKDGMSKSPERYPADEKNLVEASWLGFTGSLQTKPFYQAERLPYLTPHTSHCYRLEISIEKGCALVSSSLTPQA